MVALCPKHAHTHARAPTPLAPPPRAPFLLLLTGMSTPGPLPSAGLLDGPEAGPEGGSKDAAPGPWPQRPAGSADAPLDPWGSLPPCQPGVLASAPAAQPGDQGPQQGIHRRLRMA